jgi:hypothetical protein
MLTKSKEILNSLILLKIEPPKKEINDYLRIFLAFAFVIFSVVMSRIMTSVVLQPQELYMSVLAYVLLCFVTGIIFIRLKPRSLLLTEKGITDGLFISVLWEELEFYNFVSPPDVGPNKSRRTLRLISNKAPFYQLRFMGLPRNLYDRGLFFSNSEVARAEEIFRAKGISKER